jgi:uncharacterized protein YndB with AHSA1/START domain
MTTVPNESALTLKRYFAAPRSRVFQAWTDPYAMKQWWGPRNYEPRTAEVSLQAGGSYRVGMRKRQVGQIFFCSGTYRKITPPERLICTFRWELPDTNTGDTLLTLEFIDRGEETETILTQEGFRSSESRDEHEQGWISSFDCLDDFLRE